MRRSGWHILSLSGKRCVVEVRESHRPGYFHRFKKSRDRWSKGVYFLGDPPELFSSEAEAVVARDLKDAQYKASFLRTKFGRSWKAGHEGKRLGRGMDRFYWNKGRFDRRHEDQIKERRKAKKAQQALAPSA